MTGETDRAKNALSSDKGAERIAWAAGLFEGEGSIYIDRSDQKRRGGRLRIGMSLSTTDEDVAWKFRDISGGSVFGPYKAKRGTKPYWTWHLRNEDSIRDLASTLSPHLSIRRRRQIEDAVDEKREADATHTPKPIGRPRLARVLSDQMWLKW